MMERKWFYMGQIFETVMLICFGCSWPMNLIKAYKARTAKGTSLPFILLIITGYVAGILAKIVNGQINYVFAVYILNIVIVFGNLFVYFRNVILDRKAAESINNEKENNTMKTTEDEIRKYAALNGLLQKNGTVLFGGSDDKSISISDLKESFGLEETVYNRSFSDLKIAEAKEIYKRAVAVLEPKSLLIHIGDSDVARVQDDPAGFDRDFIEFLELAANNGKTRVTVISAKNPGNTTVLANVNRHLKNIADSFKCQFIDLSASASWNPKATLQAMSFARSMGLRYEPKGEVADYNLVKLLYGYENEFESPEMPGTEPVIAAEPAPTFN